jgi:hypothetical protein
MYVLRTTRGYFNIHTCSVSSACISDIAQGRESVLETARARDSRQPNNGSVLDRNVRAVKVYTDSNAVSPQRTQRNHPNPKRSHRSLIQISISTCKNSTYASLTTGLSNWSFKFDRKAQAPERERGKKLFVYLRTEENDNIKISIIAWGGAFGVERRRGGVEGFWF